VLLKVDFVLQLQNAVCLVLEHNATVTQKNVANKKLGILFVLLPFPGKPAAIISYFTPDPSQVESIQDSETVSYNEMIYYCFRYARALHRRAPVPVVCH